MKFLGAKKRIENLQSLLTSIISLARRNEDDGYKRQFLSGYGFQILTIKI